MKLEISQLTTELHQRDVAIAEMSVATSNVDRQLQSELEKADRKATEIKLTQMQFKTLKLENQRLAGILKGDEQNCSLMDLRDGYFSSLRQLEQENQQLQKELADVRNKLEVSVKVSQERYEMLLLQIQKKLIDIRETEDRYVEFYFFTHPSLFINNHFPMEEKWQLITPRISLKIFEDMVFRTGDFFEMGLMYIHPDVQLISTVNGRVIINIEGHSPTLFMYSLDERKDCAILTLTRYGMKLEVLPQRRGDHKLKIYAKPWDSESETYTFICAYLIKCESVDENFKLPKAFHNPMGPSWLTEMKGLLQPSHPEPLIYCNDGQCMVRFLVNKELSFTSRLSCDEINLSDEVMRSHVFKMHLGNWVEFKIQLLQSGPYVFAIFAKDKASHSPTHAHVCEYLISCANRNVHWPGFPKIFSSWTDGCELVEPLSGILAPNQMVKFKLKIPHIRKVQVYGKGACPLNMSKDGYWEGICNTQDVKHLNVGVSDKMFDNKFTFALQYEVGDI
ncbi:kyphoscoliosis peptidase-like [Hypanus sabinus]|uniref:kyphoscoliosis peptidase-like n=1 Tax=Hypanus sabinus TaxID=79690 RepID=UPI0028C45E15|nr:kyphoscoliosis peptidase-like [Hypanus sabinus]